MDQRTCSIDGCDRALLARGWCATHYTRWRKTGAPGPAAVQGAKMPCAVDGCDDNARARGWCQFHYTRWKLTGDPAAPLKRKFYPKGALCAFDGCRHLRRKLQWCSSHYSQWITKGEVGEVRTRYAGYRCVVCGTKTGIERGFRKYCSARCRKLWTRHDGDVPSSFECVICGGSFPLTDRTDKRRRNFMTKLCKRCRQDSRKHGVSVFWLAERDGIDCSICHDPVDMTATAPDPMRPSVDHVVPRARGGSNDPSNLALAHLSCNQIKSDSGWRKGRRVQQ